MVPTSNPPLLLDHLGAVDARLQRQRAVAKGERLVGLTVGEKRGLGVLGQRLDQRLLHTEQLVRRHPPDRKGLLVGYRNFMIW